MQTYGHDGRRLMDARCHSAPDRPPGLPARFPDLGCRINRARLVLLRIKDVRWNWLALALALFAMSPSIAEASSTTGCSAAHPADVCAGSFLIRQGTDGFASAPRLDTEVDIAVSGIAARVTLRQRFINDGTEWVEGVYVFPLPDNAAVDSLMLRVGERILVGEIRERGKAKKAYQKAKTAGKRAGLVEQERPNLFTSSVANLGPGETVDVEIAYMQTLRFESGQFSLRFPMTITPRYVPGERLDTPSESPDAGFGWAHATAQVTDAPRITPAMMIRSEPTGYRASIHVGIDAGFPLAYILSPYHPVDVDETGQVYEVNLSGDNVPMDRDFELIWQPVIGPDSGTAVFSEQVGNENFLMLMFMPPQSSALVAVPRRELILVIDTSGSMQGESIRQARQALQMALSRLRHDDLFNVIQFNSNTHSLFDVSMGVNNSALQQAAEYVVGLKSNGGTEMAPALEKALRTPPSKLHLRQVIFITDGAVGNEEALFRLIHKRLGNARLFTVGIGSAPNAFFMRRAAEFGRGTYTFIGDTGEVALKMDELLSRLESPVLTDIEIAWPRHTNPEVWPEIAPDLYAGQPLVLTARVDSLAGSLVVSGQNGHGHWVRQPTLDRGVSHSGISRLWARNKIESLMNRRATGGDPERIRTEVTRIALRYGLVSRFTSLIAVDKTPVRPSGMASGSAAVPSLMPAGIRGNNVAGYPRTATPAALNILLGMLLLALALLFSFRRKRSPA